MCRIACAIANSRRRPAKFRLNDLCKRSLMALARSARDRINRHMSIGRKTRLNLVFGRTARPGCFEVEGKTNAAQLSLCSACLLTRPKASVVRQCQCTIKDPVKVAAVVNRAVGRGVGEGISADEVQSPQCDRVKPMLVRSVINKSFNGISDIGSPCSTISRNRHRVGENQVRSHG